ncbi:hypothetical protein MASR2M29_17010 [Spirochaetota bacterium]
MSIWEELTVTKDHPLQTQTCHKLPHENTESAIAPDAWSKLRKQSWARLLQKVYEVDPFVCPKCKGAMSVVAIIEDPKELGKVIEWAEQQEREKLVTICARSPPLSWHWHWYNIKKERL